jgi:D-arabinose 1-dehydrogenase-like Zn-dependent alcohol dehydrogenase
MPSKKGNYQQPILQSTYDMILLGEAEKKRNPGGKDATIDTQLCRLKRITVIGDGIIHSTVLNEEKMLQLVAHAIIKLVIAATYPIEQAAEAHHILEQSLVEGKIVLFW